MGSTCHIADVRTDFRNSVASLPNTTGGMFNSQIPGPCTEGETNGVSMPDEFGLFRRRG